MKPHIAIVPVKGLRESKTRLSKQFPREVRASIVKGLLQDVTNSLYESHVFDKILVISPDPSIIRELPGLQASFLKQVASGLNAAIREAATYSMELGADSMTIVLADIPLASPTDFQEIFELGGDTSKIVLVPSLKGGTNVMTISPPNSIPPSYGRWSYSRHLRIAQKNKMNVYSISNPRLSFDVDTPHDVAELVRLDSDRKTNTAKIASSILNMTLPNMIKNMN